MNQRWPAWLFIALTLAATVVPAAPARACAIETKGMNGPVFPPDGANNVPLNVRFLIFRQDHSMAPPGSYQVVLSRADGTFLSEPLVGFEEEQQATIRIKPEGLEPNTTYTLKFPIREDWLAQNPIYAEYPFWRERISFTTGDKADQEPPSPGIIERTVLFPTPNSCDYEGLGNCNPWSHYPGAVELGLAADGFGDPGEYIGFRLWAGDGPWAFEFSIADQPVGFLRRVDREDCCLNDTNLPVTCDGPLSMYPTQVEVFDAAGNTWWSEELIFEVTDLEGYDEIVFMEDGPDTGPAEPEPTPAEPGPIAKEFVPPNDVDGCSTTPAVSLLPILIGLLFRRRRR